MRRSYDRSLGPIRMVPVELEQLLLNLLNNSIDSLSSKQKTDPGASRGIIEVLTSVERKNGKEFLVISVFDTGQGIPQDELTKVLKPFYTTKAPGEGTGLGLAICQDITRKYGGSLSLDSEEGQWARVGIRIPYGKGL